MTTAAARPLERATDVVAGVCDRLRAHPREVALAAVVLGLLVAPGSRWLGLGLAALVAVGVGALGGPRLAVLAAGALLLGALGGQARLAGLDRSALLPSLGERVSIEATVLQPPHQQRNGGWVLPARVARGPGHDERIVVRYRPEALTRAPADGRAVPAVSTGAIVALRGRLEPLERWDEAEWRRGAHAALRADVIAPTGRRRGGVAGLVDRVRERAEAGLARGLAGREAALARGMVLGQDDALDDETRDAFRASGLGHVLR